ncbi:glycine-rich RNA-binding protein RZ1A-like [Malania oleifera]|uniref:glycine-rich RNA-binding protein RZ1A-like n=1 Tax=Malania oleifera TaxID=397392 RepID=UPI0025ADA95B|nr:glycine-rich RNA-binding protein RZ1A-like [Malania oleifera]
MVRSAKAAKFLHLVQGQMTVSQYAARFVELSRFALHLAPDEKKKARKFEEGMRQNFFEQRNVAVQSQRKRPAPQGFQDGSSRGPWRGGHARGDQRQMARPHGNQGGQTYPICQTCGRHHLGECRAGRGVCYRCGRPGHVMRDCPGQQDQVPVPRPH